MGNILKEEFLKFETDFFGLSLTKNNNFYALLDDTAIQDFFKITLKKNFFKNPNLDRVFIENYKKIEKIFFHKQINFEGYVLLCSKEDVIYGYFLLFLLKVFSLKSKKLKTESLVSSNSWKDLIFDRNDFVNAFVDYIFKFLLFNEIKNNSFLDLNKDFLRVFSFRLIELWANEGCVEISDIKTKNRHFKVLNFKKFDILYLPEINLYTEKFQSYYRSSAEIYIYNTHFSSILLMSKQASYSASVFKAPVEQVEAVLQRGSYVDRFLLQNSYELLLNEYGYSSESDLLSEYLMIKKKINQFLNENDMNSVSICHSKLSRLIDLIRIKTILEMSFDNIKLYLPFMFCFRGRVYDLGNLSFTFYKEFRFCMYAGYYSENEEEDEKFHPINCQINAVVDDQFNLFKKHKWFSNLTLLRRRAAVWTYISLGAMKKTELGKKVHISSFVLKGLDLYENKKSHNDFSDIYEKIEFNYLTFLIEELKNKKTLKKWIFWKDATASCFQHLLPILGERDAESYKICNLDSLDSWYDPYGYLIDDFFKKNIKRYMNEFWIKTDLNFNEERFFYIFNRKRLKKVIMTETYGAGFIKLTAYFLLDLELDNFSENEKKEILRIWKEFFDYLSNENVLFAQGSKAINDHFEKTGIRKIINPDASEIDYSCYFFEIIQKEYYVNKTRRTYQIRNLTTIEDDSQFHTSLRANFVQSRDALLARRYITRTKMWTIHDCFSIDFLNVTFMISTINELMNDDFYDININPNKKQIIFSIFIVL